MFVREEEEVEFQNEVGQQKIMLNKPNTISHTNYEEMKHAHNSNYDNYISDECQSINVKISIIILFNVVDILSQFNVDRLQ